MVHSTRPHNTHAAVLSLAAFAFSGFAAARSQQPAGADLLLAAAHAPQDVGHPAEHATHETELMRRRIGQIIAAWRGAAHSVEKIENENAPIVGSYPIKPSYRIVKLAARRPDTELKRLDGLLIADPNAAQAATLLDPKDEVRAISVKNDPIQRALKLGLLSADHSEGDSGASGTGSSNSSGLVRYTTEHRGESNLTINDGPARGAKLFTSNRGNESVTLTKELWDDPAPYQETYDNPERPAAVARIDARMQQFKHDFERDPFKYTIGRDALEAFAREIEELKHRAENTPERLTRTIDPPPHLSSTTRLATVRVQTVSDDAAIERLLIRERAALGADSSDVPKPILLSRAVQRLIEDRNAAQVSHLAETIAADRQLQGLVRQVAVERKLDPEQALLRVSRFIKDLSLGVNFENAGLIREALKASVADEKDPAVRAARAVNLVSFDECASAIEKKGANAALVPWDKIPVSLGIDGILEGATWRYVAGLK